MFESKQTEQSQMTVNQTESIIQLSIKLEGTRALIGLSVKAVTCNTMWTMEYEEAVEAVR